MTDDTARHLAAALAYAARVSRVLVIDHDADRLANAALKRHHDAQPAPRKIKRKP